MPSIQRDSQKVRANKARATGDKNPHFSLGDFQQFPLQRMNTGIQVLEAQRSAAIRRRDDADELAREKVDLVVNAVRGNPDFGPDSPLYRALGFIPKSERRSGLTRKVKPAATTSEPLLKAA
jgi:hypothetical protein